LPDCSPSAVAEGTGSALEWGAMTASSFKGMGFFGTAGRDPRDA
jgi:hypothetical protein